MGIDIVGISRAERVIGRHSDELCEVESHEPVGICRKYLDGLKPGCYRCRGRSFSLYVSYAGFDTWLNALSQVVLGVPASEVVSHPRRFKGQPFVELVHLPVSNDIGIGPITSAKLYQDFERYAAKVKRGFQRLTAESAARRTQPKRTKAAPKPQRLTVRLAAGLAQLTGGMLMGSDDDSESAAWEWKWETYRELRRAFKLAADKGIAIFSI